MILFYWMASFSALPGLNAGTFAAAISIVSPVCRLRPVRAAWVRSLKVPKPGSKHERRSGQKPFLFHGENLQSVSIA